MGITEVTRRAIIDELILGKLAWEGRLGEPDFLARIYPLGEMPSFDNRFASADRDIYQHRVLNYDWDDDWVFTDSRFQLSSGPDEVFLRFLAETVHPVVRPDKDEAAALVASYNTHLRADGYELHSASEISGHTVYGARRLVDTSPALTQLRSATVVDASY
ncbi:hypothetical protein GCM10009789_77930 [Kribbella sancticallisti]|uniref:AbiJ-NTD3 domain-containing protein n=1 Tax=Kribbella sancticallisti TaxID=460087 RepID=A0ABN2ERS3_9ACTN